MQDQPHNTQQNNQARPTNRLTQSNLASARSVQNTDDQQNSSNLTGTHQQSGEPVTIQQSVLEQARNA